MLFKRVMHKAAQTVRTGSPLHLMPVGPHLLHRGALLEIGNPGPGTGTMVMILQTSAGALISVRVRDGMQDYSAETPKPLLSSQLSSLRLAERRDGLSAEAKMGGCWEGLML